MPTHALSSAKNKKTTEETTASSAPGQEMAALQLVDNREETALQRKLAGLANSPSYSSQGNPNQGKRDIAVGPTPIQKKENNTGLPDQLKSGIENLSGYSMDDVRVHRNSDQPAQLQAHAFAQGTDIHLAPGQEKHLPHEAWHVVQQKQGRVKPTAQLKGKKKVKDDAGLEKEADVMGGRALTVIPAPSTEPIQDELKYDPWTQIVQRKSLDTTLVDTAIQKKSNKNQGAGSVINPPSKSGHTDILRNTKANSGPQEVIQGKGSGGKKIGFDLVNDDNTNQKLTEGIDLLRMSWAEAKAIRKKTKLDWMATNIRGKKFSGTGSATTEYAKSLDSMHEEKEMLLNTDAFKSNRLSLNGENEIFYIYKEAESDASVKVGSLTLGSGSYAESQKKDEVAAREIYHKHGFEKENTGGGNAKEYIKDSNNVETRRYAYVEKNYYQMMDFLKTGTMTGRFQQNMKAAEAQDGPDTVTAGVKSKVLKGNTRSGQKLTPVQIAVAHQEMGSSPEQRGVSLTSTEKVGGTVGNAGENFRTEDGFRLKIDLARVPKEVLLLNHYAEGGLIEQNFDRAGIKKVTGNTNPGKTDSYKFGGSVRKNRELYLDHVKPEWVVEIEHHQNGGYETSQTRGTIIDPEADSEIKTQYYEYWAGFDAVLKGENTDAMTSNAAKKGIASAQLVKQGYQQGHAKTPYVSAVKAHEEVAKPNLKDEYAQFHVGYVRGRVGKEMFKDSIEYAQVMK